MTKCQEWTFVFNSRSASSYILSLRNKCVPFFELQFVMTDVTMARHTSGSKGQFFSVVSFSLPASRDHEVRNAWIGPSFPLDLSILPVKSEEIPLQYPSLSQP